MPSLLRRAAFTGRRYEFDLRSGKIDVFHVVSPMVACTGIDPQPRRIPFNEALIPATCFGGRVMKCQPPGPAYNQSADMNFMVSITLSTYTVTLFHFPLVNSQRVKRPTPVSDAKIAQNTPVCPKLNTFAIR